MAFSATLLFFGLLSTLSLSHAFPEPWLPIPPPTLEQPPPTLEQPPPTLEQPPPAVQPTAAPGAIQRVAKQQILATIPASTGPTSQPFITSPSGTYVGCLVRKTAGAAGSDFCYIQVQDTGTGASLWESECAPVSNGGACSAVFADAGLEVFDGSAPAWSAGLSAGNVETLELGDEGELKISTREGETVWKDSDRPLVNQKCGVNSGVPAFATPVDGSTKQPFGQPAQQGVDGQIGDNAPFENASSRVRHGWVGLALGFIFLAARGFPL